VEVIGQSQSETIIQSGFNKGKECVGAEPAVPASRVYYHQFAGSLYFVTFNRDESLTDSRIAQNTARAKLGCYADGPNNLAEGIKS
jgi:hypothetical protein